MNFSFLIEDPRFRDAAWQYIQADASQPNLSLKFRLYYRFFRPFMPLVVRQLLQGSRKVVLHEEWYKPESFLRVFASCVQDGAAELSIVHPWPGGADFGFVLTHDVETAEGLRNIPALAAIEEDLGFRSSWNIIPHKYKVDLGLVDDLKARGFEIGIHGFNHDGRLYFSRRIFEQRAININAALRKYDAVGFRSPMVHRSLQWLQLLDIDYDASCFDIDPLQAMPGGVGSIWPFIAGKFVELPYTLPQDHTLFIALGQQDNTVWRDKLDYIIRHSGMALMLTHPDYLLLRKHRDLYQEFLAEVRERGGYWHALPRQVANWWRERESYAQQAGTSSQAEWTNKTAEGNIVRAKLQVTPESFQITPDRHVDSVSR